jgi:hypothetical protein
MFESIKEMWCGLIICTLLMLVSPILVEEVSAQSYWKTGQYANGSSASITLVFPDSRDRATAVLIVAFDKLNSCRSEIGMIFGKGLEVGDPIGKLHRTKENMVIEVGGRIFSEKTYITKYTTGFETTMLGNENILNALKSSRNATLKVTKRSQGFSFPLDGAEAAINQAHKECSASYPATNQWWKW